MKNKLFYIFIIGALSFIQAQEGQVINHIYDGNSEVEEGALTAAEKSYRKALSLAPEKSTALHNLGNTHFLAEQYEEASQRFFQTQKFASSKEEKHRAFHNMGNVFMKKKEYQKAVESYKNALRNNPSDDETRYNYALAKELLKNEKPPEEQEQDDKKDQKDQNDKEQDDEQDKDQKGDQENKDEQDPNKEGDQGNNKEDGEPKNEGDQNKKEKDQQNKPPENKKQAPNEGQLSPQQVQSLLEAMNNQEKKVQEKVNAKKVKGVPVRGKKDW